MPASAPTGSTKEASIQICGFCHERLSLERTQCPHCAQPQLFPNVALAQRNEESQKLRDRYHEAQLLGKSCGYEENLSDLEEACGKSVAVFNCSISKLHRQIASGTDIFETYYDLESLRIRCERPTGHDWQKLRPQAEIELLGDHRHIDKLHYAALSLDGIGLDSYGECTVTLREEMISHRASCFEGNTALIYEKEHDFSKYLRSSWDERARLCTAKIGPKCDGSTSYADFGRMVLSKGAAQDDDEFVEVHVFGTMTARTFQSLSVNTSGLSRSRKTLLKAIKEKLASNGVDVLESEG